MSGSSSAIRIRAIGDSSTLYSLSPVGRYDDRKRRPLSEAARELDAPFVRLRVASVLSQAVVEETRARRAQTRSVRRSQFAKVPLAHVRSYPPTWNCACFTRLLQPPDRMSALTCSIEAPISELRQGERGRCADAAASVHAREARMSRLPRCAVGGARCPAPARAGSPCRGRP